jgi:hypothetical protein
VSMRVARSRELVAQGRPAALVARVAGISRQAIYRRPAHPPKGQRRRLDGTDRVVLKVARTNPTDGTRMVAALASRKLAGRNVNRKVGAATHARTPPAAAQALRRPPAATGLLPGDAARRAMAFRHDQRLGRHGLAGVGPGVRAHRVGTRESPSCARASCPCPAAAISQEGSAERVARLCSRRRE